MTIDRNDAPEGYEARAPKNGRGMDACDGCEFTTPGGWCRNDDPYFDCLSEERRDGQDVIFIKRRPHLVATGGRRPTPPEWAKRWCLHFRDHDRLVTDSLDWRWDHYASIGDILFVEWLP